MAQVSCELVAPKENRPNEGIMFFNIELSPMASPAFEQGRCETLHAFTLVLICPTDCTVCNLFLKMLLSKLRDILDLNCFSKLLQGQLKSSVAYCFSPDSLSCQ